MSEAFDTEYQRGLVKECVDEILKNKKSDKDGYRGIVDLMKRYEDRLYDQYNRKPAPIPVPVQQQPPRNEREASPGLRYPFVSDASFQTGYNRLYKGYENTNPQAQFQQQNPNYPQYNLQGYENVNPQAQFQPQLQQQQNPYFIPTPAKYQGYDQNYNNTNQYMNRPMHDISNQQHLLNPALGNSLGFQNPNAGFQQSSQYSFGLNAPNDKNPYLQGQDNARLQKNIELLGGIERTLPNMQASLGDNEMRSTDHNYRPQGQYDPTSYRNILQTPYGNASQYDYQNSGIRGASPARGEVYSQYEAQYMRGASPQREDPGSHRLSSYHSPNKDFTTEPDIRWSQYVNAKSRDPSGERRPNSARKSGLSASKDLRQEKLELLSMRNNMAGGYGDRDYYN